jgi:hypothetical protein
MGRPGAILACRATHAEIKTVDGIRDKKRDRTALWTDNFKSRNIKKSTVRSESLTEDDGLPVR